MGLRICKHLPAKEGRKALHDAEVTILAALTVLAPCCSLSDDDVEVAREFLREWCDRYAEKQEEG
jgi:hypothetical protein